MDIEKLTGCTTLPDFREKFRHWYNDEIVSLMELVDGMFWKVQELSQEVARLNKRLDRLENAQENPRIGSSNGQSDDTNNSEKVMIS